IRDYVGLELDPKVKGVFDRWLASERQIKEAERYYQGGNKILNLLGDDDKRKQAEERLARNRERIKARYAAELAAGRVKALEESEGSREAAATALRARPVYQALERARAAGLDRETATAMVGEQTVLDIIDRHGDVFKSPAVKPVPSAQGKRGKRGEPTEAVDAFAVDLFDESAGAAGDIDAFVANLEAIRPALKKVGYWEKDGLELFLADLAEAAPLAEAVKKEGPHARRKRVYEALESVRAAGGIDMDAALEAVDEAGIDAIVERHGENVFRPDRAGMIDQIAFAAGFDGGDAMLNAMARAERLDEALARETEREARLREKGARKWATEAVDAFAEPLDAEAAMHHPDEDIAAENIDIVRKAVHGTLSAEQRRRQQYADRRLITLRARREVEKMPLRESANYHPWALAEQRASVRAAEAAAAGDKMEALKYLDRQQHLHAKVTEAFRIRREEQKFTAKYGYRAARSELSTVEYAYREPVRDILTWLGIVKSKAFLPDHSEPNRLILPVESDGMTDERGRKVDEDLDVFLPPLKTVIAKWIREKRLPRDYQRLTDLTAIQMREVDEAVNALMNRGRGALYALQDDRAKTAKELRDAVLETLKTLPDHKRGDDRGMVGRARKAFRNYITGNLMMNRIAEEADGNPTLQGREKGLLRTIIDRIRGAEVDQIRMLDEFREESEKDFAALDGFARRMKKQSGSKFFPVDGAEVPAIIQEKKDYSTYDADMLTTIFFNMGNRDNLYTLQEGFGLTDADLRRLAALATAAEWQAIQNIGSRLERFFPLLDEVYFRQNNKHLAKVAPTPFVVPETADGQTVSLAGWYYPKVYDPELSERSGQLAEMDDFRSMMQAIHSPTKPIDGFTRARAVDEDGNPVVTRPLLLRSSVLVDHLTNATRWITHAEPLLEFRRLTMDSNFRDMFIRKLGAEKYRYLREWTNRMARPEKGLRGVNRVFTRLRNMSTIASLGFNLLSAMRQIESIGLAADKMSLASRDKANGWWWLLQGFKEMGAGGMTKGWLGMDADAVGEMRRLSKVADARLKNVNKDIWDLRRGIDPTKGRGVRVAGRRLSRDMFFHFTYAMDGWVSGMVWWGAYRQAMDGHAGFDPEGMTDGQIQAKAVAYADDALLTQQSPFQADYTAFQADKGIISLYTQFMGGVTPYFSHTAGVAQGWRRGQISSWAALRHLINAYLVPLFIAKLLKHMLFGDDDDEDESFGKDLAWGMVESMTAPLPGVREGVGALRYGWQSFVPPSIGTPAKNVGRIKAGTKRLVSDGDIAAAASEYGKALSLFVPIEKPLRQLGQAGEAVGIIEESE
ncbi:MAG: hypothetical protein LBT97_07400, partial [Planctomycetota bacterium]|nr:hypothetical protein [Planctomycetota bacterium]